MTKKVDPEQIKRARALKRWVQDRTRPRNMLLRDLAEAAGMHPGSLSNIFSGKRVPTVTTCLRLAKALGVPPEAVLRAAGLLPPENTSAKTAIRDIKDLMAQLSPKNRAELLDYAQFRLQHQLAERSARYDVDADTDDTEPHTPPPTELPSD